MYNLGTRYYDPEIGRFINADSYVSTGQGIVGHNMFAYCNNNPIIATDRNGETPIAAIPYVIDFLKVVIGLLAAYTTATAVEHLIKNPPVFSNPFAAKIKPREKTDSKAKDEVISSEILEKYHKHHIVAKKDHRASESREILEDVGINPKSDYRNLVILPQKYHVSMHTTAYHKYVTERLRVVAGDREGVEATLNSLKIEITAYSLAGIRWD